MTGTLASEIGVDMGVVPRSGVTAPGEEPTVVSGFVPESSAGGAAVGSVVVLTVLLMAFFFASTGALAVGVGVGVAADCDTDCDADCDADCAGATSGEQHNSNSAGAKNDKAFILIIPFGEVQVSSETLSRFHSWQTDSTCKSVPRAESFKNSDE
jgi:hypothetical protein